MNTLFVSVAFPPKNDPECIQTAKYFKYLSTNADLNIDVVTSSSPTLFMPIDESLDTYVSAIRQKVEIEIYENQYTNFLLRKVSKGAINRPDSKFTFHWQWKKVIRSLHHKPDVIYSRSNPVSSAMMAYKLQKHYRVPWILHLSDPWAYSPLHQFNKKTLLYHQYWEKECFSKAVKVCFTSMQTIKLYTQVYPEFADKFEWFPNVYDKESLINTKITLEGKLKIVFTGGLAANRSPEPVLRSLALLRELHPAEAEKLEVVFAGPIDQRNQAIFKKYSSLGFVRHIGVLSYPDSLNLQKEAHLLLVIDNPLKRAEEAVFFPSKVLDYLLAQRRIVAVTTRGGATDTIMSEIKGNSFGHDEIDELCSFFKTATEAFLMSNTNFFQNDELPRMYDAVYNAKRLANLILNSCKKSL